VSLFWVLVAVIVINAISLLIAMRTGKFYYGPPSREANPTHFRVNIIGGWAGHTGARRRARLFPSFEL